MACLKTIRSWNYLKTQSGHLQNLWNSPRSGNGPAWSCCSLRLSTSVGLEFEMQEDATGFYTRLQLQSIRKSFWYVLGVCSFSEGNWCNWTPGEPGMFSSGIKEGQPGNPYPRDPKKAGHIVTPMSKSNWFLWAAVFVLWLFLVALNLLFCCFFLQNVFKDI